ncbi:M23 family metallopeptidase [Paralimibaculum aggregatum]|uniref:M23 family metallopeptidase n=1 Tax=Paralimibaculum aggregatum TaxID=3036245 RepID=A0ABQ6LGC8_9RHOB|nr:M23 family metallopeptidase [Limibaculum sp. NKW23]GMG81084.1 M23 family metallopeptidase [Limibaculum sp. NKW23]
MGLGARAGAALALLAALAPEALAGPPGLAFPAACSLGTDCHIQQLTDRDPGPGAADHRCGQLVYDGHKGTDIRLVDRAAMLRGVDVLAAAPGVVRGLRDGMPDRRLGDPEAPALAGRDCGNGVAIRHDGGWETQYCHLAEGSIAVRRSDRVTAGQRLGRIGLSGATEFPHLHFALRDPEGRPVDPFDGQTADTPCGSGGAALWAEPLPHPPGGLLGHGFLDRMPDYAEVRAGTVARDALPADAPALVFWVSAFGLLAGDRLALTLYGPDGAVLAEAEDPLPRNRAQLFRGVGRKARGAWPEGRYEGLAVIRRDGTEIARRRAVLAVVR